MKSFYKWMINMPNNGKKVQHEEIIVSTDTPSHQVL